MSLCRLFNNTHQTSDITSSAFFSGYADQPQLVQPPPLTDDKVMSAIQTKHQDERPSRKLKSENRLYDFLTRSRSRSRSKNEPPSVRQSTMPDNPSKSRTSRRTQLDTAADSPGSKPPSRIQSRPLSSTTTATNTTVTPGTPKPKNQQQQQHQPRPSTGAVLPPKSTFGGTPPRPTTPKLSGARQKLQDFFSIPLGRKSSRSRSRSRPSSPRASLDIPPLPTSGIDDDPTPRPRKSYIPQPRPSQTPSPTPGPKVLRVTNATTTSSSTGSTAASIKITKLFSSNTPEPALPKRPTTSGGPPILPPLPSFVSAPIKRVTSLHRRSSVKDPTEPPTQSGLAPPKIITHTPPSPARDPGGNSSKGINGNASGSGTHPPLTAARQGYHATKGSLDSGYRYRGATMGVVNEEANSAQLSSAGHYKGKHREGAISAGVHDSTLSQIPTPRTGLKMSKTTRATKHGSFDFERPGWGTTAIQRTGSNGTTATANSTWSKNSESANIEKERESTYGPGLAGVGTLQREVSMKRAQEREEMLKLKEKRRQVHGTPLEKEKERAREKHRDRERPPTASQRTTPGSTPSGSEHLHGSSSAATGKTSSMSKATGRRGLLYGGTERKTASGSGVTRLIGLMPSQHGPFSFEPPVPSPTRSTGTASTGTAHEVILSNSWTNKAEKERERVRDEKERLTTRKTTNGLSKRIGDRAPVPVPTVPAHLSNGNAGHRSGTKGRSLDLGLGLSWAPNKVREEALLPSSGFFSRSLSGSSGGHRNISRTASGSTTATGRSATVTMDRSASGNGNGRYRDEGVDAITDVERSKLGKEVAEMFKTALHPEDYRLFRTYVHQFDAHEIPFDGPMGIVSLVENLLVSAPHLGEDGKRRLLDNLAVA
ncbi:hypothetical protein JR316_0004877 [Psilocybe cubensis]|uniref:Uncharacterized protein n=1 Tax=Psilocybe cubensis TaxID=181762 RepID=A0ACB8H548_PSICU|nr:hypothetical protein JR316_0004877 [Psilocybe cubensis]KAH9482777.1 hypothetical protein JR316_0004877 [Psilocybe cubensis]